METFSTSTISVPGDNDILSAPLDIISSDVSENSSTNSQLYVIPVVNRMVSFYGEENIESSMGSDFPNFDLQTLLTISPYGDLILNYYKSHSILTDYLRNKLMDIIVKHVYVYIMKQ